MRRIAGYVAISLLFGGLVGTTARAESGPFIGLDLGVAEPINGNYRAHVQTGVAASPFAGWMFNDFIGLQGNLLAVGNSPDDDDRGIDHENQWTSHVGFVAGPRLALPAWESATSLVKAIEVYALVQGGVMTGTSGRLTQTAGMYNVGGGIDFYVTDHLAIGGFGRFTHLFTEPRPFFLPDDDVIQSPGEQGPKDAEYATVGIGLKYDFREPPQPPECPVCVCPECPVRRKLVLRNVYFDFDKAEVRPDAVPILKEAADILKDEDGEFTLVLEGHTDSMGSDSYNQELSEKRSAAVRDFLVGEGVPAARIRSVGFGESRPAADNSTAAGRAMNRRVEQKIEE